jgi:hypothetical protein
VYKRKIEKSENCLNCEEPLSGENFCPNCGQLNNVRKPNIFELFFEMLSNLFAFDSKFYRSIGPLLFKPGSLSVAFVDGKRQQFMLPIRMFIVITVLFLFANSFGNETDYTKASNTENEDLINLSDSSATDADISYEIGNEAWEKIITVLKADKSMPEEEGLKKAGVESTFLNRLFYHQLQKFMHSKSDDFIKYILSKFLLYALLFIPFIAFLLKFFYLNLPKYYYIDHFIFAVHQQTVLMIMALVISVLGLFSDVSGWVYLILFIAFTVHFLKALKTFYKEAWWLTVFKFILLNIGFFFISGIFVVLAGMVTFLLY